MRQFFPVMRWILKSVIIPPRNRTDFAYYMRFLYYYNRLGSSTLLSWFATRLPTSGLVTSSPWRGGISSGSRKGSLPGSGNTYSGYSKYSSHILKIPSILPISRKFPIFSPYSENSQYSFHIPKIPNILTIFRKFPIFFPYSGHFQYCSLILESPYIHI